MIMMFNLICTPGLRMYLYFNVQHKIIEFLFKYLLLILKLHRYKPLNFIPEGVAEASQIFLRDAHVLPKLLSYEEL
jgi:hypothetical protein